MAEASAFYPSITRIEKFRPEQVQGDTGCSWFVFEKIHGSNVGLVVAQATPGKEPTVSLQSRNLLLPDESDFQGIRASGCFEKCRLAALKLWTVVRDHSPPPTSIIIYGEVFGGFYPKAKSSYRSIQRAVSYTTGIEFWAFDILLNYDNSEHDDTNKILSKFLDVEEMISLCQLAGMPFVPALEKFTNVEDALAFPIGFDSTIPNLLGFPPLPSGTNAAEGVIIRPGTDLKFKDSERVIIKKKIEKFREVEQTAAALAHETKDELKARSFRLGLFAERFINPQRLDSVLSKMVIPEAVYSTAHTRDPSVITFRSEVVTALCEDALKDIIMDAAEESEWADADLASMKEDKVAWSRVIAKAHKVVHNWTRENAAGEIPPPEDHAR